MENNRQEFKKRLKGLLSFVMLFAILFSTSTLRVHAEAPSIDWDGSSIDLSGSIERYVHYVNEDSGDLSISVGSGGIFKLDVLPSNLANLVDYKSERSVTDSGTKYYKSVSLNLTPNSGYIRIDAKALNSTTIKHGDLASNIQQLIYEVEHGSYADDADITLYSLTIKPEPQAYNIYVNAGEGTIVGKNKSMDSANYNIEQPYTLGSATRGGYIFKGWSMNADGSGTLYPAGTSWSTKPASGNDQYFYAVWESNTTQQGATLLGSHWLEAGKYYYLGGTKSTDGYTYNKGAEVYVKEDGYYSVFE